MRKTADLMHNLDGENTYPLMFTTVREFPAWVEDLRTKNENDKIGSINARIGAILVDLDTHALLYV